MANRSRPELDGLIGYFVNTAALRTNIAGADHVCTQHLLHDKVELWFCLLLSAGGQVANIHSRLQMHKRFAAPWLSAQGRTLSRRFCDAPSA